MVINFNNSEIEIRSIGKILFFVDKISAHLVKNLAILIKMYHVCFFLLYLLHLGFYLFYLIFIHRYILSLSNMPPFPLLQILKKILYLFSMCMQVR